MLDSYLFLSHLIDYLIFFVFSIDNEILILVIFFIYIVQ